jgi:3'(2'), 5'-bisphosphate nucleotidase
LINQETLLEVRNIAKEAGDIIMSFYESDITYHDKADKSPVTAADIAANNLIEKQLRAKFPLIQILSEESNSTFPIPFSEKIYWLVDPLDGTKEFINKNGEFTVNIALIKDGKPVMGVVYAPAIETMYFAMTGSGAFKTNKNTAPTPIKTNLSPTKPLKIACSRSHSDHHLKNWLSQMTDYELIPMGSSLKICLVADGQADIYPRLGPTSLWDIAAAQCVLEEAGGNLNDLSGKALDYTPTGQWLNPWFIANSH